MEKEKLVLYSEKLHQEAVNARAYYLILRQFSDFQYNYNNEMNMSPAFYQMVYRALVTACFMEIAKLYDKSDDTISVGDILHECKENLSCFPEYSDTLSFVDQGIEYSFPVPYQHQLKPEEECFFKSYVDGQRSFYRLFDFPDPDNTPVRIELTFPQLLDLFQKRFHSLSKKQKNIQKQRNTIYAHNDEEALVDTDKILNEFRVTYQDLQELIDFALVVLGLIIECLTGTCRSTGYSNIHDWKNTMELVKLGIEYQDQIIAQQE